MTLQMLEQTFASRGIRTRNRWICSPAGVRATRHNLYKKRYVMSIGRSRRQSLGITLSIVNVYD